MADLVIRPYEDADEPAVIELLATSLGKTVDDRYRDFFRWKHLQNPFGRSFMWVGEVDGRLAGFRSFLRWRFVDPGGDPVEAVRAVDTATHPDVRGMGVFQQLTLHGLDEMRPAGIRFVFNTPNDQSRPGYLKMGWRVEGRVGVKIRPTGLSSLRRMARSRTPADTWSLPVDVGVSISELGDLLASAFVSTDRALKTDRNRAFLDWRYAGLADVASRAICTEGGAVLVRFRRRGPTVECTVCDVVGTPTALAAGRALRSAAIGGAADYSIAASSTPVAGMIPVPQLGPVQTRRDVAAPIDLPLALTLGDVELF